MNILEFMAGLYGFYYFVGDYIKLHKVDIHGGQFV